MIAPPPGTVAIYNGPIYPGADRRYDREEPVVAYSDGGEPLVIAKSGRLVIASERWFGDDWTYCGIHVASNDPVVAVERIADPVAIGTDYGPDLAVGWAYRASGAVSPIVLHDGTPWIPPEGVEGFRLVADEVVGT